MTEKGFSLGVGSTANCNLNCDHCYSRPYRGKSLSMDEFKELMEGGEKKVNSVNFGTGESMLNPSFVEMVNYCHDRGIKLSVTSNGYTINQLPDDVMRKFNDVDISLDFPDKAEQDRFRKGRSWNLVDDAIEKCKRLGVEFSIATALMNINYERIPQILERAAKENCNLRTNIFKPVPMAGEGIYRFQLSYDQFWESMGLMFKHGELISCSEPIVNAVLGITPIVPGSPCGRESLRIHPNREVMPCVYWVNSEVPVTIYKDLGDPSKERTIPAEYWTKKAARIEDLAKSFKPAFASDSFEKIRTIPEFCKNECNLVDICQGGCASRRYLNGRLNQPDDYCPIFLGKEMPKIPVTFHEGKKDLVHSAYLCTLIFAGKKQDGFPV